jgi:nucleotide-binding universal stress UspA family protein
MKIVLAVDASKGSMAVVDEVLTREWPQDARFEVVTVADTAHLPSTPAITEEVLRMAGGVARAATIRLTEQGLSAVAHVIAGDPKTKILSHLADGAADWVFVGAHSVAIERLLAGSVANALLRHASCPVAVIRPSMWRTDDRPGKRILLSTDGSEGAEAAARTVANRKWPEGTKVRLLSAVELTTTLAQAFEPPFLATEVMQEAREQAMLRAQNAMGIARGIINGANLDVSESISVLAEKPAHIILQEAERWGADLIVVGSHGRRGWNRWWLGSVSEAVANHARCSVEVVRPHTAEPPLET